MAHGLMTDIAAEGRTVIRIWVKIRFVPFSTRMHSRKLPAPTADPRLFAAAALDVLALFPEAPGGPAGRRARRRTPP
jgi:DNA polymerase-4